MSPCDKNSQIILCRLPLFGSRRITHLHERQMKQLAGAAGCCQQMRLIVSHTLPRGLLVYCSHFHHLPSLLLFTKSRNSAVTCTGVCLSVSLSPFMLIVSINTSYCVRYLLRAGKKRDCLRFLLTNKAIPSKQPCSKAVM